NAKEQNIISTNSGNITLDTETGDNLLNIKTTGINQTIASAAQKSIYARNGSSVTLLAHEGWNKIQIGNDQETSIIGKVSNVHGIDNQSGATVEMKAGKGNILSIYAPNAKHQTILSASGRSVDSDKKSIVLTATDNNANNVLILQTTATNQDSGNLAGIKAIKTATVLLSAAKGQNILLIGNEKETDLDGKVLGVYGINNGTDNPNKVNDELGGNVQIDADKGNIISIYAPNAKDRTVIKTWNGSTSLHTDLGNNELILQTTETNQQSGIHRAIDSFYGSLVSLKSENGKNKIQIGDAENFPNVNGMVSKVEGIFGYNATTSMEAGNGNEISIYAPNAKE
ncbi:hypothetical protein, partial [Gallibacterium salpingitidis]